MTFFILVKRLQVWSSPQTWPLLFFWRLLKLLFFDGFSNPTFPPLKETNFCIVTIFIIRRRRIKRWWWNIYNFCLLHFPQINDAPRKWPCKVWRRLFARANNTVKFFVAARPSLPLSSVSENNHHQTRSTLVCFLLTCLYASGHHNRVKISFSAPIYSDKLNLDVTLFLINVCSFGNFL